MHSPQPNLCAQPRAPSASRVVRPARPAPAVAPTAALLCALTAQRPSALATCPQLHARPAPARVVSRPGWPCRGLVSRHSPAAYCPCSHNTKYCIAIQFFMQSSLLQYKSCNTILAYSSLSHNTVCVLQYNFLPN